MLHPNALQQKAFKKRILLSLFRSLNIADKIIATLDLKSMQQMRMLHSIPFNTTTFRRDFKDKFVSFGIMEEEKRALRSELDKITSSLDKIGKGRMMKKSDLSNLYDE